ncbi:MAG: hypothetical protein WCW26_02735 [Candidatus Buchananbacteria bacterium]
MEKGPKFGQNFNPDSTNRLDVLKIQDLPEYIDTSREIRDQLKSTVETEGWPQLPDNLESLEDLFAGAKSTVTKRWSGGANEVLQKQIPGWLEKIPDTEEYNEVKKILADSNILAGNLEQQQLGVLENLRKVAPEAWRTLVLASSERQLASVVLLRKWAKDLQPDNFEKMGVSLEELNLLLDSAGLLGKYFDQAHVKQIELADAPGGSQETPLGDKTGAGYLYDIDSGAENGKPDSKTYGDVFVYEWPKIVKRLEVLADRTEKMIAAKKLPESYLALPDYLRQVAAVYGSKSVSPKELDKIWSDLYEKTNQLAVDGCPIMLIPQGCSAVAGEANKVDIEMRLGFQTKDTQELGEFYNGYRPIAQAIIDQRKDSLADDYQVPAVVLNVQPFAFGPNNYYMTPAESGEKSILSHTNVMRELAANKEFPVLSQTFTDLPVDLEAYKIAANHEAVLHEVGHSVLFEDDKNVRKRIGRSSESNILEELKAETVGMAVLNKKLSELKPDQAEKLAKQQFTAKLGAICHYLAHESSEKGSGGERYYYTGAAVISELMTRGIIVKAENGYQVTDYRQGIEVLAQMGEKILADFYGNTDLPAAEVRKNAKAFIGGIKKQTKSGELKDFIQTVRG